MSGMLAAKMLSAHFEQVTLLERDPEPKPAAHRAGIPQSKHLHVLLRGGQQVLEGMFPGIERDLADAGSVVFRVGYDVTMIDDFGAWPRRDLGLMNCAQSRPLLDHVVRSRLAATQNIAVRWNCRVDGLLVNETRRQVAGVRYHDGTSRKQLAADLVVDTAGRQGRALEWLRELGYTTPEETRIEVDFGYATALFTIPQPARLEGKGLVINPGAPAKRAGLLQEIEGGRWIVSLAGRLREHPPTDLTGFMAFAKSLVSPLLYDAIEDLEPLEQIAGSRYPVSIRRRFEKLTDFPDGLIPLGDSLCNFNPIYAQGMSSAAKQVEALGGLIGETVQSTGSLAGLWRTFFPIASEVVATPWTQAGSADLAYPETNGTRPSGFDVAQQFSRGVIQLALQEADVHKLLAEVTQLVTPRAALRDPALVKRVTQQVERNAPHPVANL